jgi:hypothetical protein
MRVSWHPRKSPQSPPTGRSSVQSKWRSRHKSVRVSRRTSARHIAPYSRGSPRAASPGASPPGARPREGHHRPSRPPTPLRDFDPPHRTNVSSPCVRACVRACVVLTCHLPLATCHLPASSVRVCLYVDVRHPASLPILNFSSLHLVLCYTCPPTFLPSPQLMSNLTAFAFLLCLPSDLSYLRNAISARPCRSFYCHPAVTAFPLSFPAEIAVSAHRKHHLPRLFQSIPHRANK